MSKTGFFGYSVLALLAFIWGANALNTHRVRYQITVEVDTPQGVRSGAGMVQVLYWEPKFIPVPSSSPMDVFITGEAAFVDLGDGKHVIALLTSGPRGKGVDWPRYVWQASGSRRVEDVWEKQSPARVSMVLPPASQPTLVSFTDIANPATARVVPATAQGFEASFGAGYALRSITMTYVDPGLRITHIWPFNQWAGIWPRWLFGEPLTTGIETKLPFLVMAELRERNKTMQIERPGDPFRIGLGHLSVR